MASPELVLAQQLFMLRTPDVLEPDVLAGLKATLQDEIFAQGALASAERDLSSLAP